MEDTPKVYLLRFNQKHFYTTNIRRVFYFILFFIFTIIFIINSEILRKLILFSFIYVFFLTFIRNIPNKNHGVFCVY